MTARAEVTRPVAYQQPSRWHRIIASEHLAGWAFVAPAVILIAVFALIPPTAPTAQVRPITVPTAPAGNRSLITIK